MAHSGTHGIHEDRRGRTPSPRLLHRHRVLRMPLAEGQLCFYRRRAGAPRLLKSRRRGPAIVLTREDNAQGKPHTHWMVHSMPLLRCAPEPARSTVEDEGKDFGHNLEMATQAAATICTRSTTRHTDIRNTPPPPLDVHGDGDDDASTREAQGATRSCCPGGRRRRRRCQTITARRASRARRRDIPYQEKVAITSGR